MPTVLKTPYLTPGVLADLLKSAVARSLAGPRAATLLFSGGLDSSLLAWLARREPVELELLTVSLPQGGDLLRAAASAKAMGLTHRAVLLREAEVLSAAQGIRREGPQDLSLNDLSVQTGMALALKAASHETVLCGQGADELFLGYAHSRRLEGQALGERAEADLTKLLRRDFPFTQRLASTLGRSVASPYLDPTFREGVAKVPWADRTHDGESKPLLRELAAGTGLPAEIVQAPKRAFQYGTGIHKLLRRRSSPGIPEPEK